MRNVKKTWFLIAAFLLVVGLLLFGGAMIALGFDFTKLNTGKYETNTYEISEDFRGISIDVSTTEIEFVLSDHEKCKVVCFEDEKEKHSVAVKDRTLIIDTEDTRKWYDHIGFTLGSPKMTVYLPKAEYASLLINTHTGDIEIPDDFQFENLKISGTTADVECLASGSNDMEIKLSTGKIKVNDITAGALDLSTTTGNIKVNSVTCGGTIGVSVSTGSAEIANVSCETFTSHGTTGHITLKNVIASDLISVERSTGGVTFEGSDAAEIYVKTTTGSVKGTLLSDKVFIAETDTGSVNVPKTVTGGKCEIKTTTGNIKIEIQ